MPDLLDLEGQIDTAMRSLKSKVDSLSTIPEADKKKAAIAAAKAERAEVKKLINSLRAMVRTTTDKTDKMIYEKKRVDFDDQLSRLQDRITEAAAPPAGAGTSRRGKKAPPPLEVDGNQLQTTQEVFSEIHNVQDKTLEMAKKTLRVGANAEEISLRTIQTLQKQNEIIVAADDALDGLDSNLKRASRQVSAIARKMAGDKVFLMLFCVLVLALAVLIFYKIYKGRQDKEDEAPVVTQATTTEAPPEVLSFKHFI